MFDVNEKFIPLLASTDSSVLASQQQTIERLTIVREGAVRICYAPFDYVTPSARVVVVGITPGYTQMVNAISAYRRALFASGKADVAIREAKMTGAFSGALRQNLIALLDSVGVHQWLSIESSAGLFDADSRLMHTDSVLRYPVFINDENYNGTPNMLRSGLLKSLLMARFAKDAARMDGAIFVPLGDKVADALTYLVAEGALSRDRIVYGLPHPSGANAERIAYFLGKKRASALSAKTNSTKIDKDREMAQAAIKNLLAV